MFKTKLLILAFSAFFFIFLLPNFSSVDGACSVCNTTIGFACMSKTQYATCNSTAIDLTTLQVCPSPTICNETIPLNTPLSSIPCYFNKATESSKKVNISCSLAVQTFVIETFSSAKFCASRTSGLYTHPTKTCAYYIRCFINSALTGAEFMCPGNTRFNVVAQKCDTSVTC